MPLHAGGSTVADRAVNSPKVAVDARWSFLVRVPGQTKLLGPPLHTDGWRKSGDLLWLDGKPLFDWPAYQRRVLLEAVELPAGACVTPRWPGSEAATLIEGAGADRGEVHAATSVAVMQADFVQEAPIHTGADHGRRAVWNSRSA
jgi:hypothetical protein